MKTIAKKICAGALALVLSVSMLPGAALAAESLDNFQKVNTYTAGKFTDVAASSWYAESVQKAYELDLVKGSSGNTFSPTQNLTISSTLALACRLHSIYHTGKADFQQGEPWYQVYVDYAVENGIITAGQFTDYNANATRRQFAGILVKALPAEELKAINTIEDGDIPDLAAGSANYGDIYTLYRAGILTGSDKYGTFLPETPIDRASVATIISRMALPDQRRQVTLEEKPVTITAITLDKTTLAIQQGESGKLTASVTPANSTEKLTWTSSNKSVATVAGDGTVTAVAPGTAVITAAAPSGVKATCTVTVSKRALSTQPLYEDSNVSIKFSKVQKSRYDAGEAELYLDVTNKTGSTITVQADAVSLNGYTFNDLVMSADVSANSTGTVRVTIKNYDSSLVNLNSVQTVGGQFRVILGGVGSGSKTTHARFDATNLYTGKTDDTIPAVSGKEKLYSDENVEFYYGKTQKYRHSDDGSQIEVYLLVRNKTNFTVMIQNDTVVIDGRSYDRTTMSHPVLAHSTGYVKVTVREYSGPTPSTVTTVGGDFRVIDDLGDRGTYTITLGGGSSGGWEGGGDGDGDGGDNGSSSGGSSGGNTGNMDLDATYSGYSNIPDFGGIFGVTPMSEEPDDNSTMYVYDLKDIPGGPSNRRDVLDLYVKLLKGKGFVYSNSQGGINYGYTYDVYQRGILPSLEYMVSVGTIYKGTTPVAIAINVIDMQK
ncbi:Ig-like domain-containing protein [Flavonifractor porci]|uniref:Ig-like domain-containing protein n=1 Tax=Flavonifractor porci TaxID=3133422 RepID=UPI0030A3DEB8